MAGIEAFLKGWVSRMLPQAETDNDPGVVRLGRYGDVWTIGGVRKQHGLADEGSYFVTNNAQTGLAATALSAPTAASPFLLIANTDTAGNQNAKRIHLDYINLLATAAGGAASTLLYGGLAIVVDTGNRYSSGGTNLTANIVNPNADVSARASIASVYAGAIVAAAATGNARTLVGLRNIRQAVSATVLFVVGDVLHFNFGGVEPPANAALTVANAHRLSEQLPPVIIGPGQCALIYIFGQGATTPSAPSLAPELGWWER